MKKALGTVCMVLACTTAAAETLYRYIDKDGKVTYSDKRPTRPNQAQPMKLQPGPNPGDVEAGRAREQRIKDVEQSYAQAPKLKAQREKEHQDALAALDTAKKALETARAPDASDRQSGKNGSRTTQEYQERVKALEEAVKTAEQNVEKTIQKRAQ